MIHAVKHLVASSVLFHWNCPLYLTPLLVREIVAVRELVTPVNRNICQQSLVELVSPTISMELESNFLQFLFGWFHYFHTITKGLVQSVSPPAEWNSNLTKSIIGVHVVIKATCVPSRYRLHRCGRWTFQGCRLSSPPPSGPTSLFHKCPCIGEGMIDPATTSS